MSAIDVVSDASVALKWFHSEGEEELDPSRAILTAHQNRTIVLYVLDLTAYEVGNGLLRGQAGATAGQVATVLEALAEICPSVSPDPTELRAAAELAVRYDLSLYDAAYAAVAENRRATLVTLDHALLDAGLGMRPSELAPRLLDPGP